MHACAIILHLVVHGDGQSVAPIGSDDWAWVLAIDKQTDIIGCAIKVASCICDCQVVRDHFAGRRVLLVEIGLDAVTVAPAFS